MPFFFSATLGFILTHIAQARCISRYGVSSITTSASFEHTYVLAQEESQGQPICIYLEDDDDAMVLDLDSSSASAGMIFFRNLLNLRYSNNV